MPHNEDSPANMLGHPGFSALEYAGCSALPARKVQEKDYGNFFKRSFSRSNASTTSYHEDSETASTVVNIHTESHDASQAPVDDFSLTQRRRGTFLNHTPRGFEVLRQSTFKVDMHQTVYKDQFRPYAMGQQSSDKLAHSSIDPHNQHLAFNTFEDNRYVDTSERGLIELDDTEVERNSEHTEERSSVSTGRSRRMSYASRVASRPRIQPPQGRRAQDVDAASTFKYPRVRDGSNVEPSDDQDRKTLLHSIDRSPYFTGSSQKKLETPSLAATESSRHSPLEPLVAQHRREVTGSDVDPLPPHVDIEDVSGTTMFLAMQEYFICASHPTHEDEEIHPQEHDDEQVYHAISSSAPVPSSPLGHTFTFPAEGLEVLNGSTPSLPDRSPLRVSSPTTPHRGRSGMSLSSDFASAAEGQYSPYDQKHDSPQTPRHPEQEPILEKNRACLFGRIAPPIPNHRDIKDTKDLDNFNLLLRNTGPPSNPGVSVPTLVPVPEKKSILGFRKPRSKKSLAAKVGSVEGSPGKAVSPAPPVIEMKTSTGKRHLHILVDADKYPASQTKDIHGISRRISFTWTEEMLQPLGSAELETAISVAAALDEPSPAASVKTVLRNRKPVPTSSTPTRTEHHPLLVTRDEQTRTRKLRDLDKAKKRLFSPPSEDTVAGALPTPVDFPDLDNFNEVDEEESAKEVDEDSVDEVTRLTQLAAELAEELAKSVELDLSNAQLSPWEVLDAYRAILRSAEGPR